MRIYVSAAAALAKQFLMHKHFSTLDWQARDESIANRAGNDSFSNTDVINTCSTPNMAWPNIMSKKIA